MNSFNDFLLARSYLSTLEDIVRLDCKIDFNEIRNVCDDEKESFTKYHASKPVPNNRYGLPLISEENFKEFYSPGEINKDEMDFQYYTKYIKKIPTLANFLRSFQGGVGRTHILRFGPGGFFPPHRDGPNKDPLKETFRLFFTIKNCEQKNFTFLVDSQQLHLKDNSIYFINTFKQHSAFCYGPEDTLCAITNIQINTTNLVRLSQMLGK